MLPSLPPSGYTLYTHTHMHDTQQIKVLLSLMHLHKTNPQDLNIFFWLLSCFNTCCSMLFVCLTAQSKDYALPQPSLGSRDCVPFHVWSPCVPSALSVHSDGEMGTWKPFDRKSHLLLAFWAKSESIFFLPKLKKWHYNDIYSIHIINNHLHFLTDPEQ